MENKLRCHKVLITGGSSGIGLAIAKRLLEAGATVVISGKSIEKLEAAASDIASDRLFTLRWDVSDISACKSSVEAAAGLMNGLDGLVNNAANGWYNITNDKNRSYEPWDMTGDEWDAMSDVAFKGAFFVMRDTVDHMLSHGARGNILNISSNAACMGITGPYGAAKLALARMTRAFGNRFGHNGIIINAIAPGATLTPIIRDYAHSIDQKYTRHAIERFIRPEEIAELAYYLMSECGEIICGSTVIADGGDNAAAF